MTRYRAFILVFGAVLITAPACRARAAAPYDLERSGELAWVGTGLALSVAAGISQHTMKLPTPGQAAPDAAGINSFDRRLMQPYREDHVGDALVTASFAFPFALLGRDDVSDDSDELVLMWLEAALLNHGLVGLTKALAQRPRPFMYDPDAPAERKTNRSARLSFYSGHTAFSAMNTVFTATVFSDYSSDRNAEIAMWTGAVVYSAATAFCRVNTGHHFPTDVVTGFVVGAAVGYLVPVLHRTDAPEDGAIPAASTSRTLRIGASFSF